MHGLKQDIADLIRSRSSTFQKLFNENDWTFSSEKWRDHFDSDILDWGDVFIEFNKNAYREDTDENLTLPEIFMAFQAMVVIYLKCLFRYIMTARTFIGWKCQSNIWASSEVMWEQAVSFIVLLWIHWDHEPTQFP